jgi:hypothetical protein
MNCLRWRCSGATPQIIAHRAVHFDPAKAVAEFQAFERYDDVGKASCPDRAQQLDYYDVFIPAFSFPGFDSITGVLLAKHRPKFPTALRGLLAKPLLKQDR